jgi:galactokinase
MSSHNAEARDLFEASFGRRATVVASAPGRVNLIGEHTDYNGGEVLPIGIARRTWVAAGLSNSARSRAITSRADEIREFDHRHGSPGDGWWDYVVGVGIELERRGIPVPPFDLAVSSDVPAESGLSSSAALEIATGAALLRLAGATLGPAELALIGNRAENQYVGVQSGVMDQFASALARDGHALHLYCDSLEFEHVPVSDAVLIFDTRVPRSLRASAFNQRRQECEIALALLRRSHPGLPNLAAASSDMIREAKLPNPLQERARHVVEEILRVHEVVDALGKGARLPGPVLLASHESLRDLYDCSTKQLDWFVERAMSMPGVTGARLTGAGWGGCAIATGAEAALEAAAAPLRDAYRALFGIEPAIWITRASFGVEIAD